MTKPPKSLKPGQEVFIYHNEILCEGTITESSSMGTIQRRWFVGVDGTRYFLQNSVPEEDIFPKTVNSLKELEMGVANDIEYLEAGLEKIREELESLRAEEEATGDEA